LSTLHHVIDLEWLKEAYRLTRKDGAPGIDGVTAAEYAENLEANLLDLLDRIKSGRYQAPPVRRVYIPKGDGAGSRRPLGLPTLEDKVCQRAIVMVLELVYEQDLHGTGCDRALTILAGEEAGDGRLGLLVVVAQDRQQLLGQHDIAILPSLALAHVDHHALAVDIGRRERDDLRDAQTCRVDGDEDGSHPQVGDGRNMSPLTQAAYVRSVANFAAHYRTSPDKLTFEDVRNYQVHLVSRGLKTATIIPIMCAIRFLYGTTLCKKNFAEQIPLARKEDKLPTVLSRDEVMRFLKGRLMSSIMRCRSGVVGLVMEYSRRKDCWRGNPDGHAVDAR
jgi:Phage integrase, N-terminal SAM-like domain